MASSSGSLDRTALYPAPKRITVTSCGDGIEVRLETEKSDASTEEEKNNNNNKESSPTEPVPAFTADVQGEAVIPTSDYFETELETKTASFVITDEEWGLVTPRKMPSGGRLLTGPWAHILSNHLRESNPYCSFAFHYNRLKTEHSRKRMAPFFKAIGTCRVKECSVMVRLLIRGINESKRLVDVSYNGTLRHRVPVQYKPDHVRNEKSNGMLLLGVCRDSEPGPQHLPNLSIASEISNETEELPTIASGISKENEEMRTASEKSKENEEMPTASEVSKENDEMPTTASEKSKENEEMPTIALANV